MPEMTEQEFTECMKDQWWRFTHLYYIVNKVGKIELFKPNTVQEDLYHNLWYENLILKSRQHGVTTFFAILELDICLFNDNISAGIICHKEKAAEEILENKIRFAYKHLPQEIRDAVPTVTDKAGKIAWANGSSIYVDCSLRSGTTQYLHVSEFGRMCAFAPERAMEVVTGALNTVTVGQYISIESTAEGMSGKFYDYCMEAIKLVLDKSVLNPLQFKFHFYSWFHDSANIVEATGINITPEHEEYFTKIEQEVKIAAERGIMKPIPGGKLTQAQKCWWVAKREQQGEAMYREQPATPEEAFKASLEGLYYQKAFVGLYTEHRICGVAYEPRVPVDTGWDLGISDPTVIWFSQTVGPERRIIDYLVADGEGLEYYVRRLQEKNYVYGTHFLPWDGAARRMNQTTASVQETLQELGLRNVVCVPATKDLVMDVEKVRQFLPACYFDKEKCQEGIKALENYRKEFDENRGVFKPKPLHDWASHGASAFATLARGLMEIGTTNQGPSLDWLKNRKKPDRRAFH